MSATPKTFHPVAPPEVLRLEAATFGSRWNLIGDEPVWDPNLTRLFADLYVVARHRGMPRPYDDIMPIPPSDYN
jgi:hypothetical protein